MYETVTISKPKSSRMANSEKYLVCKNFKYTNIDHLSLKLVQIIKIFENIDHTSCYISSFISIPWQLMFKNRITDYSHQSQFHRMQMTKHINQLLIQ